MMRVRNEVRERYGATGDDVVDILVRCDQGGLGLPRTVPVHERHGWDLPGCPGLSQPRRYMQPDIPAVPGISRDILGYGGNVRSQGPRFNMSWDVHAMEAV